MCGIFGFIGNRAAAPLLVEGLRRLEYRGYDSSGLCYNKLNKFFLKKKKGKVSDLESLISKKTKAIIPVHMLGVPADMILINRIGKRNKIPIVEDACEAIGAKVVGKYVGGLSEFGVFSFDFGKMITTGEGGALFSKKKSDGKNARMYH
ncbi:MAG TPA: hypothetical protein D7H89_01125, partial [Candidatus Poseidoniales archaeon]